MGAFAPLGGIAAAADAVLLKFLRSGSGFHIMHPDYPILLAESACFAVLGGSSYVAVVCVAHAGLH